MPPIYSFECNSCHKTQDEFRHVDERNDAPEHCGKGMERVISPSMVYIDNWSYPSPITGKEVRGKVQRKNDLKRSGCREVDPSEKKTMTQRDYTPVKLFS